MEDLMIPMNEVTRSDTADADAPTFADVMPLKRLPSGENYAEDKTVQAAILDEILPLIEQTRASRAGLHDEWQAIRRMEFMIHDSGKRYNGRSDAYLPIYARLMKTQVSTLAKGLFPSDEYMDCVDRTTRDPEKSKATKAYVQYEFERNAKLRRNLKVFLRQLKSFGNSPLKFLYRKEKKYVGRRFDVDKALLGPQREDAFLPVSYEGLQLSTRSIFNFYVYPMTADNLDEATLVFENMELPRSYIEQMGRLKKWKNVEEALNTTARVSEVEQNRQDLQSTAFGVSDSDIGGRTSNAQLFTLTEAWTFLKLPRSAYVAGEDPDCPVPVCIILAGHVPLCVIRNPYFHQRPPYLFGRLNTHPGMIYGYDVGRMARSMQYLCNDFANQTNDTGTYTLNPIAKINPAHLVGPLRPLAPGAVLPFTNIKEGLEFDRPPFELVGEGLNMVAMLMNWTQDLGGAPPQLSGSGASGAKTATGMQILQRNALSPLQDEVEDIEQDILIPLMYGTWMNGMQFRDRDVLAILSGGEFDITPESLKIDAEFRWLASSQAINAQQRAQQATMFLQTLLPALPVLMQQGYVVDLVPIFQRIFSDGMGFRGFQDVIKRAQVMPGMGGVPSPEQMGGVQAEQGDRVRSALEQVGGAPGDMVPGEGDAFGEVRNAADSLAAYLGATHGQG